MPTKANTTLNQIADVKHLYHLPPDPHVSAMDYWQWHNRVVTWPCSPETFRQFWERVDSYKPLRLWAEELAFERLMQKT